MFYENKTNTLSSGSGTVDRFEDVGKLIQVDSESAKTPEDEYFVVHSAFGTTEGPLFETAMVQSRYRNRFVSNGYANMNERDESKGELLLLVTLIVLAALIVLRFFRR